MDSGGREIASSTSAGLRRIVWANFLILGGIVAENITCWQSSGSAL